MAGGITIGRQLSWVLAGFAAGRVLRLPSRTLETSPLVGGFFAGALRTDWSPGEIDRSTIRQTLHSLHPLHPNELWKGMPRGSPPVRRRKAARTPTNMSPRYVGGAWQNGGTAVLPIRPGLPSSWYCPRAVTETGGNAHDGHREPRPAVQVRKDLTLLVTTGSISNAGTDRRGSPKNGRARQALEAHARGYNALRTLVQAS